jgi:hypothetical protein
LQAIRRERHKCPALTLKKWWKRRLPEFYKMLLGDAETVVMHHSGLSDDEVLRSQRLLVAVISVFDFQRTKEVRANAPRRSTTGPVTVFAMWFKKTGKQKEAAHAREADNWRYTLMAR